MCAPIIIFVYNRVDRVKNLIDSLIKNPEAKDSILYIFSDGAKKSEEEIKVQAVRDYIDTIPEQGKFLKVYLIKSNRNKGLAPSIIDGVTKVMEQHGRAIIIEDDTVVASDFLDYMNRGLNFYKDDPNIWAISGFTRELSFPKDYEHDIYIMQRVSSYTWASWKDRWDKTEWNVLDYPKFLWNRKARKKFDECGADRSLMLDAQMCKKISSWAIRFEYSMVKKQMYSVFPCVSRALCTGNDGSGTHSTKEIHAFDTVMSDGTDKVVFEQLQQDERIRRQFVKPYKQSLKRRLIGNLDYIIQYHIRGKR